MNRRATTAVEDFAVSPSSPVPVIAPGADLGPALTFDAGDLDLLAAAWTRVGAFFAVAAAPTPVDLETLIVATAAAAPRDERLFVVAASWLAYHHVFVHARRLRAAALATARSGGPTGALTSAALGALLEVAAAGARARGEAADSLAPALAVCQPLATAGLAPRPLFDIVTRFRTLRARAEATSSSLFARWGVWHDSEVLKPEVVRPVAWLVARAPELRVRAWLGATLEAEVLTAAVLGAVWPTREATVQAVACFAAASYAGTHEAAERLVARGLLIRERSGVRQLLRPTRAAQTVIAD